MVVNCYFGIYDGVYVHEVFEGLPNTRNLTGDAMFYAMSEQIFYGDEGIWKTVKLMFFYHAFVDDGND